MTDLEIAQVSAALVNEFLETGVSLADALTVLDALDVALLRTATDECLTVAYAVREVAARLACEP